MGIGTPCGRAGPMGDDVTWKCRLSLPGPVHRVSPGVKLPLADAADMKI